MAVKSFPTVRHRRSGKGCLLVLVPALAAVLYLTWKVWR